MLWKNEGVAQRTGACIVFFYRTFPSLIIVLFSIQFIWLISRQIIFTIWEIRGVQSSVCNLRLCRGVLLELWNGTGWKKRPWFSRPPQRHEVFESKIESCFKTVRIGKIPTQQCCLWLSPYFECSSAMPRPLKVFRDWCEPLDRFLKCIISSKPHINREWGSPGFANSVSEWATAQRQQCLEIASPVNHSWTLKM